ncbi:hypothetical protein DEM27_10270 [Metarhizobium album]|uniref:Uncharacterized protein n=1 Tax=Metarhizobium album TaxID=2182425 RepID=A0A2U2DU44_9HYPH|nr:hypothetical protein DEM27_10270 [Rhizobium album]
MAEIAIVATVDLHTNEVFQALPNLRWFQPEEGPARLQSAWRGHISGKIEWRDVPTVTKRETAHDNG